MADTPQGRHLRADTPLPSACWDTHTPAQCMLGYTPPHPRRPLQRTVRILLECTLVLSHFFFARLLVRHCYSYVAREVMVVTGRNEVGAKVMFLHVSVILYTGGVSGEPPRDQADTTPPRDQADPPGRTPPGPGRYPPRPRRTSPGTRQTPPRQGDPPEPGRPPWDQADPPSRENPPPREEDCSIRSMSGRYASYWNAFLLNFNVTSVNKLNNIFMVIFFILENNSYKFQLKVSLK